MANIFLNIEKGLEVAAEDALKFITGANSKIQNGGPGALAGLGVVVGAVDKALTDIGAAAANPASLTVNFGADVADLKAVWPAVKEFLKTIGVNV